MTREASAKSPRRPALWLAPSAVVICSNDMRNFRFAVVAFLSLAWWQDARADETARELVGTSFHWELNGTPQVLVLVSEKTAWWISEANRYRAVQRGETWEAKGKNRIVWHRRRFDPLEINIRGKRFSMSLPGAAGASVEVEGKVFRMRK